MAVKLHRPGRRLVSNGKVMLDDRDDWSEHQPSAAQENAFYQLGAQIRLAAVPAPNQPFLTNRKRRGPTNVGATARAGGVCTLLAPPVRPETAATSRFGPGDRVHSTPAGADGQRESGGGQAPTRSWHNPRRHAGSSSHSATQPTNAPKR
jgi:hypothetical protein